MCEKPRVGAVNRGDDHLSMATPAEELSPEKKKELITRNLQVSDSDTRTSVDLLFE